MITEIANKVWSKKISSEWTWIQIEAILGVLWGIFILASGGNYNITGTIGMVLLGIWLLVFILAIITYPFMQPIHKRDH
jgi:hypothetical protein